MIFSFLSNYKKTLIGLFLVAFIITTLNYFFSAQKKLLESKIDLNSYSWLSNQFPLLLNDLTGAYTFECLHTDTVFKNYKILENINVKASIECVYLDQNSNQNKIYLPVAIEIIQNNSRTIQFLAGFNSSGIYENSTMTETAIINVVNNQITLNKIENRILARISHPDLLSNGNSGFDFVMPLFDEDKVSKDDIVNFTKKGNANDIQINTLNRIPIIFAENIHIKNI